MGRLQQNSVEETKKAGHTPPEPSDCLITPQAMSDPSVTSDATSQIDSEEQAVVIALESNVRHRETWFQRIRNWKFRSRTTPTLTSEEQREITIDEKAQRLETYGPYRDHLWTLRQHSYEEFDKQILGLASLILGLSLTFLKDIVPIDRAVALPALFWAWGMFGSSILSTLLSFISSRKAVGFQLKCAEEYYVNCRDEFFNKANNYTNITEFLNTVTAICFVAGFVFSISFAAINITQEKKHHEISAQKAGGQPSPPTGGASTADPERRSTSTTHAKSAENPAARDTKAPSQDRDKVK